MAESALTQSTLVTYSVLAGGKEIPDHYNCVSIRVSGSLNKITHARLEYLDGGGSEAEDFSLSNQGLLDPAKEITIKVGYESKEEVIFKGIIVKHSLTVGRSGDSYVIVECKDKAVKATVGRKNAVFYDKKDSDIIKEVAKNTGLKVKIEDTGVKHKELIQHNATDWDFMLLRAEVNGMLVNTKDGELVIEKPEIGGASVLKVDYGTGLINFNGEIDARNQYKNVVSNSWDMSTQKLVTAKGKPVGEVPQGKLKSNALSNVIGLNEFVLQSPTTMSKAVLENWASSRISRSRLSKIKGNMSIRGNAKVVPGATVEIEGLSDHFNGKAFISKVTHSIQEGDWTTEVTMGISDEIYAEEVPFITSPPAAGIIPSITGLHIGIVKAIHDDPEGNHRVQVTVPTLQKDNMPVWARLSGFYASKEAGVFFFPEISDEVVIGFLNDDPQSPIILGSMYSKALKPKYVPEDGNGTKSIFTKGGLEIKFNDTDKILTIQTPAENTIVLDDKEKSITVEDKNNKNKLTMSGKGIALESDKDIKLIAKGGIVLESKGSTEIKATQDFSGEGVNVTMKGKAKFAAEGAQVEVKGSAMTTIKGGLVQIN